ncbi:unnamed protein product [Peniophora sp. CBMAI 1063]|nr:unnamed protein product [Peniophora sp. CBMAI 1063]
MADDLLSYAPPEFEQALRGLPRVGNLTSQIATDGAFVMAHYIVAALDNYSADWTDYTRASSPYLPTTPSRSTFDAPDAHVPPYLRSPADNPYRLIHDERLLAAVKTAIPSVPNVYDRPSGSLPEMGVWSCPECDYIVDPLDLSIKQRALIASYLGVGSDSGISVAADGRVGLDRENPWQFMRSVDCLGWSHYAEHLRTHCVRLWFPNPSSTYQGAPGMWWDQDRLNAQVNLRPLRQEIEDAERTDQYRFRMWKAGKMLSFADKGLHAARFHLTSWRRGAVSARDDLVRGMFGAGRTIIDTGRALVAHVDAEAVDATRLAWQGARDECRSLKREWRLRKQRWARMYLGP